MQTTCFNNKRYLRVQIEEIVSRMSQAPSGGNVYVEFGGKAYDDQHAARVLPGYDPHNKLYLLQELSEAFEIVVAVSARDILKPRIRGDSQLFYDMETIRIVKLLQEMGNLPIRHGVITMCQHNYEASQANRIASFVKDAKNYLGLQFEQHSFIPGYPHPTILESSALQAGCPKLDFQHNNILVFSPGGGSGKFCVCLAQLLHDFLQGKNSLYLKFETFPVFTLPPDHPVNLAFLAATADLGNQLLSEGSSGLTTYDKDAENFRLLKSTLHTYCPDLSQNPMKQFRYPSDMGVNKLTAGFIDLEGICQASIAEIGRRILRYQQEIARKIEFPATLSHLFSILPLHVRDQLIA